MVRPRTFIGTRRADLNPTARRSDRWCSSVAPSTRSQVGDELLKGQRGDVHGCGSGVDADVAQGPVTLGGEETLEADPAAVGSLPDVEVPD